MSTGSGINLALRFALVGDSGVGLTSLLNQYSLQYFSSDHNVTDGANCVTVDTLEIWENIGRGNVPYDFFETLDGGVLVFDVHDKRSFDGLADWRCLMPTSEKFPFVVFGNKVDLDPVDAPREVSVEEATAWCQANGNIPYFETSAKEATNLEQAFQILAKKAAVYLKEMLTELRTKTADYRQRLRTAEEKVSSLKYMLDLEKGVRAQLEAQIDEMKARREAEERKAISKAVTGPALEALFAQMGALVVSQGWVNRDGASMQISGPEKKLYCGRAVGVDMIPETGQCGPSGPQCPACKAGPVGLTAEQKAEGQVIADQIGKLMFAPLKAGVTQAASQGCKSAQQ